MAIVRELSIVVTKNKSSLSPPVYLYVGDRGITFLITIIEKENKFASIDTANNLVEEQCTKYASVCIQKPNGELVIDNKCLVINDKIQFVITKDLIDHIDEQGEHKLQVHLFDEDDGRITIPPVSFTVSLPICIEESNTPHMLTDSNGDVLVDSNGYILIMKEVSDIG